MDAIVKITKINGARTPGSMPADIVHEDNPALARIARKTTPSAALAALRRRFDEHLDDDALAMIEDPADDAETLVEKEDCRAIVQHCLAQLSPAHREVLDLVYYHEKSVNEAAEIVGIPANTVKTRMFYARTRMEKFLKLAGVDAF
jgi:RNA polymerase sigma factor (sigma-70 family)